MNIDIAVENKGNVRFEFIKDRPNFPFQLTFVDRLTDILVTVNINMDVYKELRNKLRDEVK